jgi:hypothetical protein
MEMGGNGGGAINIDDLKGTVVRLVEGMDEAAIRSMASELVAQDGFSETLINGYPRFLNLGVQVVRALVESLEQMPVDRSADMLAQALKGVDGKEVGETINSLSRLLIAVHQAKPGLMAESRVSVISDAVGAVDFGKLRVALTAHYHSRMSMLEGKVDHVVGFPLGLANLLNVVPPLVNDLLRILAKALEYMKFPDELLASALFTLVQDVDMNEVGRMLNAASELVIALSHGDWILGSGGKPMLKKVLYDTVDKLAAAVDGLQLKEAALALGGDGKVIGEVFSEHMFKDERTTLAFMGFILTTVNSLLRSTAGVFEKLSELPPETLARLAEGLEDDLQAEELGRAINAAALILNRISESNPDLVRHAAGRLLSALEPEQTGAAARTVALQLKEAVLANPELSARLAPAAVGQTINSGLASFNRFTRARPALVASGLNGTLSALDAGELSRAVEGAIRAAVEAALANREVVRAVMRPVIAGVFKYFTGSIRNARIFRRPCRRE